MSESGETPHPPEDLTPAAVHTQLCDTLATEGHFSSDAYYLTRGDYTLTNVSDYYGTGGQAIGERNSTIMMERHLSILEMRSHAQGQPSYWIAKPNTVPQGSILHQVLTMANADLTSSDAVILTMRSGTPTLVGDATDAPEVTAFLRNTES